MKSLGQALEKMLKNYGIDEKVRQHESLIIWKDVVGDTIAAHAKADSISADDKLIVKVDSPVWRNELYYQRNEILEKINSKLKSAKIKEIVLR